MNFLKDNRIETKIYHTPLVSDSPVYKQYIRRDTPNARKVLKKLICIPVHEKLTNEQVDYIINKISLFYK